MNKLNDEILCVVEEHGKKYLRKTKSNDKKLLPLNQIMKLINSSRVYAPKLLKNKIKYIDLEYIKGDKIKDFDRKTLIDTLINYFVYMYNLDSTILTKYISWKTNSEYFHHLINKTLKMKRGFDHNTKIIIELLNLGKDETDKLKKLKIDDTRKLSLINPYINYENMLLKFNRIYIINWDYATYADLANELAMHFADMDYSEDEKKYILDMLSKRLNLEVYKLKNDIKAYQKHEKLDTVYQEINYIFKMIKEKKEVDEKLERFYSDYQEIARLLKVDMLPFEEVREIFKNIK